MARKYWLKLEKDFLKSTHIKVIKNMQNGKDYILFYLALMLESVETVGHLRFSELVPYNEEMLSSVTETNVDIVRSAVKIFRELGLIEILEDGTMFLPSVPDATGSEVDSAERVRKFRSKQQALPCNNDETKGNDIKRREKEEKRREEEKKRRGICKQAIAYLNTLAGKRFSLTDSHFSKMNARMDEGATLDDFKCVVDIKCSEWNKVPKKGDQDMRKYLRPETLFGTKFQSYLNEPTSGDIPNPSYSKGTDLGDIGGDED